jgi:hypothetical protein
MAAWPEITLPRSWEPLFPSRCVACGQADPTGTYRASIFGTEWWFTLLAAGAGASLGGARSGPCCVHVPACEPCQSGMRRQRRRRRAVVVTIIIAAFAFFLRLFAALRGDFGEEWLWLGAALAAGVACAVPLIVWLIFFPPPILVWVFGGGSQMVAYRFRDSQYAEEFASLNDAAVERRWA